MMGKIDLRKRGYGEPTRDEENRYTDKNHQESGPGVKRALCQGACRRKKRSENPRLGKDVRDQCQ